MRFCRHFAPCNSPFDSRRLQARLLCLFAHPGPHRILAVLFEGLSFRDHEAARICSIGTDLKMVGETERKKSRKLAVASWSLSCFSKEGGSPGPECCYLLYQDYTPPPPSRGSTPPFSSSVPAAAAAWSLLLLLASHLRLALGCLLVAAACMLGAAGCSWLLAGCCCLLLACLLLLDAGCLLLVVCSVLLLLLFGVVGCCWC